MDQIISLVQVYQTLYPYKACYPSAIECLYLLLSYWGFGLHGRPFWQVYFRLLVHLWPNGVSTIGVEIFKTFGIHLRVYLLFGRISTQLLGNLSFLLMAQY